eukprot:9077054-Prorocentrum_lima.AAC.1
MHALKKRPLWELPCQPAGLAKHLGRGVHSGRSLQGSICGRRLAGRRCCGALHRVQRWRTTC